jgi:hypothetical protein
MSNAPAYKGKGQPALSQSTGWLGRLGNLVGQEGAPAYHGTGQPVRAAAGLHASAAPVYRQAPATQPTECTRDEEATMPDGMSVARAALVYSEECDPFARGPIAIIVPRQG